MSTAYLCSSCVPEGRTLFGFVKAPKPTHCYGDNDDPGTPGLIGSGNYCPCECRSWPHQPHELYAVAGREHPDDDVARRDRYIALMVEHGHIIPKPDEQKGSQGASDGD